MNQASSLTHEFVHTSEPSYRKGSGVEIQIFWASTLLHVAFIQTPRAYVVGEATGSSSVDFVLPAAKLGARQVEVLSSVGRAWFVFGEPLEHEAERWFSDLRIVVRRAHAERILPGASTWDTDAIVFTSLSLLGHAGALSAFFFASPTLSDSDEDGINENEIYLIRQALDAEAERERDRDRASAGDQRAGNGASSDRASGEEGAMGRPTEVVTQHRSAARGDSPARTFSRAEALLDAQTFGMISVLRADPDAPHSPWAADAAGNETMSALGNMFGDDIGDSKGTGLGLTGVGDAGGGKGLFYGLGSIGTCGKNCGGGWDGKDGIGTSGGPSVGGHTPGSPRLPRLADTTINGRIPPDVIQRVVRQNWGRFRACYETGLRANPNLQGRVAARFVVGRDGAVSNVGDGGSDLPDANVTSCVLRAFGGISFPPPSGGIVTVSYPIVFSPQ